MIRFVGLAVAFLLTAGCSSNPEAGSASRTLPLESASAGTGAPTGAPAPGASPSLVENNGTLESPLSDFRAEVAGTSWATSLTDSLHGTTRPAGRYLLVRVSLHNITDRPVTPPAHLSLHGADGSEFPPLWDQTFGQTVLVGHGKVNDLGPGARTTVVLVYDVPRGTKPKTVADLKL
ncbi:hypothetical protein [Actinomadura oligospora]|uniref:hypothetical protein n=1 Tax=Actinomadura oligospora TaxID=111804 RepID=UPI0004AC72C7|nr:hypothetical protein [Actinomadura oligospora]